MNLLAGEGGLFRPEMTTSFFDLDFFTTKTFLTDQIKMSDGSLMVREPDFGSTAVT